MNILQEVEAMRQRMLQEINTEFDILIDHIIKSGSNLTSSSKPYEIKYPLTAGTGIFKGKKPTSVIIKNEEFKIKTWKELVKTVMEKCIQSEKYMTRLYDLVDNLAGKTRMLLANSPDGMRSPIKVTDNIYMETHYDTETLLNILITRILIPIGYDLGNISVIIRNNK